MHGLNPNGGGAVAQVYAVVDYSYIDSCSDTDGGIYPLVYGSVSGYFNGSSYSYDDFCSDASNTSRWNVSRLASTTHDDLRLIESFITKVY